MPFTKIGGIEDEAMVAFINDNHDDHYDGCMFTK